MLTKRPGRVTPADGQTDADVIERSRIDPGCFGAIFDRHAEEILRYAHARLGPDLAEHVTAETFLAAFRHRDRYDTTRPDARPWLYGIAVRQIGRHRRAGPATDTAPGRARRPGDRGFRPARRPGTP